MERRNTLHRLNAALRSAQNLRHAVYWIKPKMTTVPQMTLMFLGTVICLGAAFVWMFWELQRPAQLSPSSDRVERS
jgi:hypothetical protein